MAGVIQIHEMSASMTGTDKTSSTVRFKLADNATVDTNNPITIPATGVTRSFTKKIRMYVQTAPDTNISNPLLYSDGTGFGTGVSVNASNVGVTFAANATAALADGVDLFSYTTGSELDMDVTKTGDVSASGYCFDLISLQLEATPGATSGTLSAETVTIQYDEI